MFSKSDYEALEANLKSMDSHKLRALIPVVKLVLKEAAQNVDLGNKMAEVLESNKVGTDLIQKWRR